MSVVEFIFRKAREVFNFTKDRLHLLVPRGIWKIFTTYISCAQDIFRYVQAEDCNTHLHEFLSA